MSKTLVEKFLSKIFSPSRCCFCKSVSLCKYKTLELRSKRFEVRKPVWKPVCHFQFHWGWRPEVENRLPIGRGRSRDQNTGFLLVRPPALSLDLREESINGVEQWEASMKSIGQWKASIKQYCLVLPGRKRASSIILTEEVLTAGMGHELNPQIWPEYLTSSSPSEKYLS